MGRARDVIDVGYRRMKSREGIRRATDSVSRISLQGPGQPLRRRKASTHRGETRGGTAVSLVKHFHDLAIPGRGGPIPAMTKPDLPRCVILGGGCHARVLIDCIRGPTLRRSQGIVPDPTPRAEDPDVPVLGGDELLGGMAAGGVMHLAGLGGVGTTGDRSVSRTGCSHRFIPLTMRHPPQWSRAGRASVQAATCCPGRS